MALSNYSVRLAIMDIWYVGLDPSVARFQSNWLLVLVLRDTGCVLLCCFCACPAQTSTAGGNVHCISLCSVSCLTEAVILQIVVVKQEECK